MPVDTKHPDYQSHVFKWARARDVTAGEDAVKAGGEKYLPKLAGDDGEQYKAYKDRGHFFNASGRTVAGFKGMAFRKPMALKFPAALKPLERDATMGGSSLQDYGKELLDEVLVVGRAGTLVEFSEEEGGRPYFALYKAEQIINWQVGRVNGRNVLKFVVLDEMAEVNDLPKQEQSEADAATEAAALAQAGEEADEFEPQMVRQLRVLRLESLFEPVGYIVDIYRMDEGQAKKEEWKKVATIQPTRRAKPLDFIPFVFHTASNCGSECERPPLEDIILNNISHWRNSADYEHGLHFTATPTPYATGVPNQGVLRIGSSTAWLIEQENAKVGMLEFTGNGLKAIKEAMEQKEHHMAVLGAKMLEAPKRASETAEAWRIKAAGEATTLTDWVMSTSESLTTAARMAAWWIAPADTKLEKFDAVTVTVNTEFISESLSPDEIRAFVIAFQSQTMSLDTVIHNFARGGLLPQGKTPEDEKALIETQAPPGGMQEQQPPGNGKATK